MCAAQYRSDPRATSTFTLALRVGLAPHCPICTEPLQPAVVAFLGMVAFCERCAGANRRHVRDALDALRSPWLAPHCVHVMNLRFYCPRRIPVIPAFQLMMELEQGVFLPGKASLPRSYATLPDDGQ